jgi:hypothetical protein
MEPNRPIPGRVDGWQVKDGCRDGPGDPLEFCRRESLDGLGKRVPEPPARDYVFPWCESKQVEPLRPTKGWRTAWRNACKRAGFKLRFHDLRHTAITKLAESQASNQTVMSIAGHVSQQMLEHYSHIRLAAKRAALDSIATSLPEPAGEKHLFLRVMCTKLVTKSGCLRMVVSVSC